MRRYRAAIATGNTFSSYVPVAEVGAATVRFGSLIAHLQTNIDDIVVQRSGEIDVDYIRETFRMKMKAGWCLLFRVSSDPVRQLPYLK